MSFSFSFFNVNNAGHRPYYPNLFYLLSSPPLSSFLSVIHVGQRLSLCVCVAGVGGTTEAESGGRQGEAGGCGPRQGPDPGAEQLRAGKCQRQTQAGERKCAVRELSGGR